jgi:uncharacterized membrane protein
LAESLKRIGVKRGLALVAFNNGLIGTTNSRLHVGVISLNAIYRDLKTTDALRWTMDDDAALITSFQGVLILLIEFVKNDEH